MAKSPTKPSTPRLSEVTRHVVVPSGIVTTGWPRVRAQCEEWGDRFDLWQDGLGTVALGKRANGHYAATVGGITLSIPRQVAKTFIVGRIVFALCALFPGLTVLWTAHRTRTATRTFQTLQGFARRKKVAPYIGHIRTANGEQEIGFRNGSVIMFGAREQGFGRGFDEIDIEVFDEAQILTERALEDMIAATNQSRHEAGALLFFMGTPPRPVDPGEAFQLKRSKALSGKSDDMVYVECSADPDADPDDRKQWAKANPSYPKRTPLESMLRLRENLLSDDAWRREALGVWDEDGGTGVFTAGAWSRCETIAEPGKPAALGIAADVDQVWLSLGAASSDSVPHLGSVLRVRDGKQRDHFVSEVGRIQAEHHCAVVVDKRGPASPLIPALELAGVDLTLVGLDDFVQACADICDAVETKQVTHGNYEDLNAAVNAAGWRPIADRRAFARKKGDVSSLEAAALALWGIRARYDVLDSVL